MVHSLSDCGYAWRMSHPIIPIHVEATTETAGEPMTGKPSWLKVRAPMSPEYKNIVKMMRELKLNTVCEEASCPNIGGLGHVHDFGACVYPYLCFL